MRKSSRRQHSAFRGLELLESREMFSFGKLLPLAQMKAGPTPKPTTPVVNAPAPTPAITTLPAVRAYLDQYSQGRLTTITNASYKIAGESRVGIVLLATIFWGDGTSSDALLTRTTVANQIAIGGGHAYQKPGTYTLRIQLSFTTDNPTLVHAPMIKPYVAFQAPVTVTFNSDTGVTIKSRSRTISGVLGTIANPGGFPTNPLAVSSLVKPGTTVTGTVAWGDGSTSAAQFRSNRAGGYDLLGAHTYAADGIYRVHIEIDSASGSATSRINEVLSLAFVGKVPGNVPFLPLTYPAPISDLIAIDAGTLLTSSPVILSPIHFGTTHVGAILNGSNGLIYTGGAITSNGGVLTLGSTTYAVAPTDGARLINLNPGTPTIGAIGSVTLVNSGSLHIGNNTDASNIVIGQVGNNTGGILNLGGIGTIGSGVIGSGSFTLSINGGSLTQNFLIPSSTIFTFHADGSADATIPPAGKIHLAPSIAAIPFATGILTFDTNVSSATIQTLLAKLPTTFAGTIELPGNLGDYPVPTLANATLVWLGGSFDGSAWTGTLDASSNALVLANAASKSLVNGGLNITSSSRLGGNATLALVNNGAINWVTTAGQTIDANSVVVTRALLGNANLDGNVDLSDFDKWYKNSGTGTPFSHAAGDVNMDGSIDLNDFDLWYAHVGSAPLTLAPTL